MSTATERLKITPSNRADEDESTPAPAPLRVTPGTPIPPPDSRKPLERGPVDVVVPLPLLDLDEGDWRQRNEAYKDLAALFIAVLRARGYNPFSAIYIAKHLASTGDVQKAVKRFDQGALSYLKPES